LPADSVAHGLASLCRRGHASSRAFQKQLLAPVLADAGQDFAPAAPQYRISDGNTQRVGFGSGFGSLNFFHVFFAAQADEAAVQAQAAVAIQRSQREGRDAAPALHGVQKGALGQPMRCTPA